MRRPANPTSLFLLLNVALLFLNVLFISRRGLPGTHSAPGSHGAAGVVVASAPDDQFLRTLMAERSALQQRVAELSAQASNAAKDSDISEQHQAATGDKLRTCRAELTAAKQVADALQDEVARAHHELELARAATAAPAPVVVATTAAALPLATPAPPKETEPAMCPWGKHNAESDSPFLIIGIPTVPRRGEGKDTPLEATLLVRTLESMRLQIEGAFGVGVRVLVMNNRPGKHVIFERARAKYAGAMWIEFHTNESPLPDDDVEWAPEFVGSTKETPTEAVRRQTLDVVSLLAAAAGRSRYYFFTEDDFAFCDNTLMALRYMIQRADEYLGAGVWAGIRCSFGLNGIVMHNAVAPSQPAAAVKAGGDLAAFRGYLQRHFNRRPPDHLVVEWYAKESEEAAAYFGPRRRVMAFRYNVVEHLGGQKSTLRSDVAWSFPGCFTELIAPQVFVVEAWNPVECPHDDIWPCKGGARVRPSMIVWNNATEAHVSNHRTVYVLPALGDNEAPAETRARAGRRGKPRK